MWPVQGPGLGRFVEDDVHGADAAFQRHGGVPRRPDPAECHPAQRARRHGQACLPARLHLPVAAAQGRTPYQVQRRHLQRGLHALVHSRPTGYLEHPLLRRTHGTVLMEALLLALYTIHSFINKQKKKIADWFLYRCQKGSCAALPTKKKIEECLKKKRCSSSFLPSVMETHYIVIWQWG
jgi:hypothetical protein